MSSHPTKAPVQHPSGWTVLPEPSTPVDPSSEEENMPSSNRNMLDDSSDDEIQLLTVPPVSFTQKRRRVSTGDSSGPAAPSASAPVKRSRVDQDKGKEPAVSATTQPLSLSGLGSLNARPTSGARRPTEYTRERSAASSEGSSSRQQFPPYARKRSGPRPPGLTQPRPAPSQRKSRESGSSGSHAASSSRVVSRGGANGSGTASASASASGRGPMLYVDEESSGDDLPSNVREMMRQIARLKAKKNPPKPEVIDLISSDDELAARRASPLQPVNRVLSPPRSPEADASMEADEPGVERGANADAPIVISDSEEEMAVDPSNGSAAGHDGGPQPSPPSSPPPRDDVVRRSPSIPSPRPASIPPVPVSPEPLEQPEVGSTVDAADAGQSIAMDAEVVAAVGPSLASPTVDPIVPRMDEMTIANDSQSEPSSRNSAEKSVPPRNHRELPRRESKVVGHLYGGPGGFFSLPRKSFKPSALAGSAASTTPSQSPDVDRHSLPRKSSLESSHRSLPRRSPVETARQNLPRRSSQDSGRPSQPRRSPQESGADESRSSQLSSQRPASSMSSLAGAITQAYNNNAKPSPIDDDVHMNVNVGRSSVMSLPLPMSSSGNMSSASEREEQEVAAQLYSNDVSDDEGQENIRPPRRSRRLRRSIYPSQAHSEQPADHLEFDARRVRRYPDSADSDSLFTFDRDQRQIVSEFGEFAVLAKNLPHEIEDEINSLSPGLRQTKAVQKIFESVISNNTAEDEPLAPPIRIVNDLPDDHELTPPWEFHYTNKLWHSEKAEKPDFSALKGCNCAGSCKPNSKTCSCVARQNALLRNQITPGLLYNDKGKLRDLDYPIVECNMYCGCDDSCRNRVVQHGRQVAINIQKTRDKGWGIFAREEYIPANTFIGVYSGEFITEDEAHERGMIYDMFGRTYLFDVDFWHLNEINKEDTKYCVDAYHAGNFTRYLNHSCDPNCKIVACYINETNIEKPLLTIFTCKDVEPGEELCFSYFGDIDENIVQENIRNGAVYTPCKCGSKNCTGRMWK
ncbi:hypothetical protein K474DRAFT_87506 [Panus rudis PR-1116 ss-1]|nr:hypothetical protein K474DRAFT_87506 [Panus rudis PR-1116 ss-1]